MRVDGYNQISQIYSTKKTVKKQDIKKTDSKDQVLISSSGRDYQIAKRAVASSPDIREDRVNTIKTQIKEGTYSVDNESFAEKLLKKYEERFRG